mgnify:CR=1 FL=1
MTGSEYKGRPHLRDALAVFGGAMDDQITEDLRAILSEVFAEQVDPGKDVSLIDKYHADDFDLAEIMVALENRFGLDIPDEDISYFTGTAAISAYLSRRLAEIDTWITGKE